MSDATDYSEDQWAGMWFENQAPDGAIDGPAVALWSTTPSNDPDFTNEVSGGNYSRVQTSASNWNQVQTGSPVEYENSNDLDFGTLDNLTKINIEGVVLVREDLSNDEAIYVNSDVSESIVAGGTFTIHANGASFLID